MIAVRIMGGLGNQMFQYATALAVANNNKTSLKLDISSYQNMADIDTPRQYELDVYNISATTLSLEEIEKKLKDSAESQNIIGRILRRKQWHKISEGEKKARDIGDNSYLVGWWQDQENFLNIRDLLQKEFEPKNKPSDQNQSYLDKINNTNSVSIHVRRGDYVSNNHANVFHGLAPIDYYKKSIEIMREKVQDPVFYVFSDDLEWCEQNLPLGEDAVYVSGNVDKNAYEDIRLMKNCKHNIIANSSFSWWGAWLNKSPSKIVITPLAWFQDEAANNATNIVPQNWQRV